MPRLPLIGLFLALATPGPAQYFSHWGTEQGLHGHATALLKEPGGYLWVASQDGLQRWDGERFKTFRYDPQDPWSIPHDHVERMALGADGRLWITSVHGGLVVFDPMRERFLTWEHLTGNKDPNEGRETGAVHWLPGDSLLVGNGEAELWLYVASTGRTERLPRFPGHSSISEFMAPPGHPGELLVVARRSVHRLNVRDLTMHELLSLDPRTVENSPMISAFVDAGGTLWAGTWSGGLIRIDKTYTVRGHHLPEPDLPVDGSRNIVYAICPGEQGRLLIGTEKGLLELDTTEGTFTHHAFDASDPGSMPKGQVFDLLRDDDGVVYIARQNGLSKWDPAENTFQRLRPRNVIETRQPRPFITACVEHQGRLIVGTEAGDGILIEDDDGMLRPHPFAKQRSPGHAAIQVRDMLRTRDGRLIVFARTGIFELDTDGPALHPILPHVSAAWEDRAALGILEDHAGHWWFGRQERPLVHVDPISDRMELIGTEGPASRRLSSIGWSQGVAEDAEGRIWLSAYKQGIDMISADRQRVTSFRAAEQDWLPTDQVWDVEVDPQGRLWLGTNGQGIIVTSTADPGGPGTRQLLGRNDLPSRISSLALDPEGYLWASGPTGLFRIDPATFTVHRMGRSEGITRTNFHHASIGLHPSGRVTIPVDHTDLLVAHFEDLEREPGTPPVSIRDIRVNGSAWSSDTAEDRLEHLALPPNTHLVEVGYAAIAFTLRDRLQLQHQLVGVDPAPVPTGSTGRAIYTGLGPGEHRLLISDGRDPDGMDHPLRELLIRIEPTFLQRGWVRASLFAALLLLVIGLVQWRLKLLRERERMRTEHIKQVAEVEMMALRAQMNPHFLFNCLNAINRYIVRNDREAASGYLTKFSRLMRNVLQNSKEQLVTLKDELDTLRLYVELEQLRFNERFDFDLRVELEDDPAEIRVPPMLLQPYVENAIWHGLMHRKNGPGSLQVRVFRRNGTLVMEVEDDGIGRKQAGELKSKSATAQRSMGMRLTRERLELARRTLGLDIRSQVIDLYGTDGRPSGTKVILELGP